MPLGPSKERFVGFYWTFGDTRPANSDAQLGRLSFTVREQRRMVEEEVRALGGYLLLNFAYQERGHRPTAAIVGTVAKAIRECERLDAALIYVDFDDIAKWRPHRFYSEAIKVLAASSHALPVGDPERLSRYFSLHRRWTTPQRHPGRPAITKDQFDEILTWQIADMALPPSTEPREFARRLNERGFRTFTGARWTEANARHTARELVEKGLWAEPSALEQARGMIDGWVT